MQDPHKSGTRKNTKSESYNDDEKNERPEFTQEELQAVMDKLKEGKDTEDIKTYDDTTKELTRQIFNEVMKQEDCTPEAWRRIRMTVMHKKDDVEEVGNYRPLRTLSAMYKLLSTLVYNRLYPRFDHVRRVLTFVPNAGSSCNKQTA